eukprot:6177549-Pleurochrysis_carterae.AAC.1
MVAARSAAPAAGARRASASQTPEKGQTRARQASNVRASDECPADALPSCCPRRAGMLLRKLLSQPPAEMRGPATYPLRSPWLRGERQLRKATRWDSVVNGHQERACETLVSRLFHLARSSGFSLLQQGETAQIEVRAVIMVLKVAGLHAAFETLGLQ